MQRHDRATVFYENKRNIHKDKRARSVSSRGDRAMYKHARQRMKEAARRLATQED